MAGTRKPVVEVRRSQRRRRTVSAYRDGERVVVLIPDQFSRAEETRVGRPDARPAGGPGGAPGRSDAELLGPRHPAASLYLAEYGDRRVPASVRWVTNQNGRWGSCTPADRTIRISHRVQDMPDWVIDYVLLHELAHLIVPSHNARFWALVGRYPKAERARGYLEGVAAASGSPLVAPDRLPPDPAPFIVERIACGPGLTPPMIDFMSMTFGDHRCGKALSLTLRRPSALAAPPRLGRAASPWRPPA